MYHSISRSSGPTSIPPETFRRQIEALCAYGYRTVPLTAFQAWLRSEGDLPAGSIVITFDDGFADFAQSAFPILRDHNYTATVFLPTGKMGGMEDWQGIDTASPRRLMTWPEIADLAKAGIEFGGYSVTHADLTKLPLKELRREIRDCRDQIERRLGRAPAAFAPPYGRAGNRERQEIRSCFDVSVGTRLEHANQRCDRYDLPRIEMHYFRDLKRWRVFLEGRGELYFRTRRLLRGFKELATEK